jgi:DNA-binding beta-propeller fold protein YncE
MKTFFYLLIPVVFFGNTECSSQSLFHGYDLHHPSQVIKLPHSVNEISGITYQDGYVFAIDDEHGTLYKIKLTKEPNIQHWTFGTDKDYEDVVLANQRFYILNSNGHIVEFDENFPVEKTRKEELKNQGRNEYESLYYDPTVGKLIVLCKDCADDKKNQNTAYSYDPSSHSFDNKPLYVIDKNQIEKTFGKKIGRFKPSAATVNPVTKEVYVLSSINKLLVTMKDNKVQDAIELPADLFKQPEGITFSPSGGLLISNEAAQKGAATILIFDHK